MPPKMVLSTSLDNVPEGFTTAKAPDGTTVLIPQFLFPDLHSSFAAYRSKMEAGITDELPKFTQFEDLAQEKLGDLFDHPCDPTLSVQERLSLHSEVQALQTQLGISYQDASHRLYMAEIAKLKMADKEAKAWANLASSVKETLENIDNKRNGAGDSGEEGGENHEAEGNGEDVPTGHT